MTVSVQSCLFCRQPLVGKVAIEHIVPDSIGGWLTTSDICTTCNSNFGSTVDSFVGDSMIVDLRREAGLSVGVSLKADAVDKELNDLGEWVIRPDGTIERPRDIYFNGDSVTILGSDLADARRKGDEINAKRIARGKEPFVFQEQEAVDYGVRRFTMTPTDDEVDTVNDQMAREGAKIAIEYISMLAGSAVALSPSLDTLRAFASQGAGSIRGGCDYIGEPMYWLPRTRRL